MVSLSQPTSKLRSDSERTSMGTFPCPSTPARTRSATFQGRVTGKPVTPALAPTSNIVVHVVSERRLHEPEGPRDILGSSSARATASDCFGDGSFSLSRPLPPSSNDSRGISTWAAQQKPHVSHVLARGQTHCKRRRKILNQRLDSTGPHIIWTPFLLRYRPASLAAASGDNASSTGVKATKPLPCGWMLVFDRQEYESSCPAGDECLHS